MGRDKRDIILSQMYFIMHLAYFMIILLIGVTKKVGCSYYKI